jgi:hypothetical protein
VPVQIDRVNTDESASLFHRARVKQPVASGCAMQPALVEKREARSRSDREQARSRGVPGFGNEERECRNQKNAEHRAPEYCRLVSHV